MLHKRMSLFQTAVFTASARGRVVDSKAWEIGKTTTWCTAVDMHNGKTLKHQIDESELKLFLKMFDKNPAHGRQQISQPMRIEAPILFFF